MFIKMSLKNVLHVTFNNFDEILVLIWVFFKFQVKQYMYFLFKVKLFDVRLYVIDLRRNGSGS